MSIDTKRIIILAVIAVVAFVAVRAFMNLLLGGPQQTPAIPPAKYKYRVVTSRQNVPKQSLSPRIFT